MTSNDIRKKFLGFFEAKGHKVLPSASLVPENDPTVLFTTAGMHPLIPYILGQKHPSGKRLASAQKCIRTGDIDEVGDESHLTFFEMLGNWSLGDYGKKEAIKWSFEFLTGELGIDSKNLAITCFEGMPGINADIETKKIWMDLGIPESRIKLLGKDDNFWGPPGIEGPCGPDTEMFVWTGNDLAPEEFDSKDSNWLEIWNDVFMEFRKVLTEKGKEAFSFGQEFIEEDHFKYIPLEQKNVDTGMGLERMVAYLEGNSDVYQTDLFWPIIEKIEELSEKKYEDNKKEFRIIADHVKAAIFIINDGVLPSNKDRGYIARRLIRRSIVAANSLGINSNFTADLLKIVGNIYQINFDLTELKNEEIKFRKTLASALIELKNRELTGAELFNLYQSYGLPIEIAIEEAHKINKTISENAINEFKQALKEHQAKSRTASAGMFKGGLADAGEETTKLHTAAHLMLAALRQVLGDQVEQKGSNITAERLRFDFNNPEKLTSEQIKQVEEIVNKNIKANLPIQTEEMSIEEAKKSGATGVFNDRYGEKVKVYSIGPSVLPQQDRNHSGSRETIVSREICGGPHVERCGKLGHFKIIKEESSSAGVRRIKAILK